MLTSMLVGFALSAAPALQRPLLTPEPPAGLVAAPRDATVPPSPPEVVLPKPDPKNPPEYLPEMPARKPAQVLGDLRWYTRHWPHALAASPDGKLVACDAGRSATSALRLLAFGVSGGHYTTTGMRLFDARTGHQVAELFGPPCDAVALRFSPDSARLYSGRNPLSVYDMPTRRHLIALPARDWSLSGDGRILATLERELKPEHPGKPAFDIEYEHHRSVVRLRDTATWAELAAFAVNTPRNPGSLALSPDGNVVALGCDDGTVRTWDRRAGRELTRLGDLARVFDPAKGRPDYRPCVARLAFDPTGARLAAIGVPGSRGIMSGGRGPHQLAVWDWPAGTPTVRRTLDGWAGAPIFSTDGKSVAAGSHYATAVFDAATGAVVASVNQDKHKRVLGHAALAADGKSLYVSSYTARLGAVTFPWLDPMPICDPPPAEAPVPLPFATDGALPPERAEEGALIPWGGLVRTIPKPYGGAPRGFGQYDDADELVRVYEKSCWGSFAVSPGGAMLATHTLAGGGYNPPAGDEIVRLYDLRTGASLGTLKASPRATGVMRFSPDGKRLALLHHDGLVRIWDVATLKPLMALDRDDHPVAGLTWSKDGRYLVGGHDQSAALVVWDTAGAAKP